MNPPNPVPNQPTGGFTHPAECMCHDCLPGSVREPNQGRGEVSEAARIAVGQIAAQLSQGLDKNETFAVPIAEIIQSAIDQATAALKLDKIERDAMLENQFTAIKAAAVQLQCEKMRSAMTQGSLQSLQRALYRPTFEETRYEWTALVKERDEHKQRADQEENAARQYAFDLTALRAKWDNCEVVMDRFRAERDAAKAEIDRWRDAQNRIRDEMGHQATRANDAEHDLGIAKAEIVALREALQLRVEALQATTKEQELEARTSADYAHLTTIERDRLKELEALRGNVAAICNNQLIDSRIAIGRITEIIGDASAQTKSAP